MMIFSLSFLFFGPVFFSLFLIALLRNHCICFLRPPGLVSLDVLVYLRFGLLWMQHHIFNRQNVLFWTLFYEICNDCIAHLCITYDVAMGRQLQSGQSCE